MDKVILKDKITGMYVRILIEDFGLGHVWDLDSIDNATGLMISEADKFIEKNKEKVFTKDAVNCITKHIVETEEQANEAFFNDYENPPESPEDWDEYHEYFVEMREAVWHSIVCHNVQWAHLENQPELLHHNLNHNESRVLILADDRSVLKNKGPLSWMIQDSEKALSEFQEWFVYSNWYRFFDFGGDTVTFDYDEILSNVNDKDALSYHDEAFLDCLKSGILHVSRIEYMDNQLEQRKLKALSELDTIATEAVSKLHKKY